MSSPGPSGGGNAGLTYPYTLSFQSNASVAIIIVVLGATFFFMFLFLVYIKRCGAVAQNQQQGAGGGAGDGRGGAAGWNAVHGLDPEVLKKFPIMRYASVKHKAPPAREVAECAVCLGQFEESERLRLLPACGHSFHPECIDLWLETHSTCPLCRRSLDHDAEIDAQQAVAVAVVVVAPPATADPQDGELLQQRVVETAAPAAAQQEQASTVSIMRTLSRNSESFKSASHEAELREVRERLRATSGRFAASSTPSSPSPLVRLLSRGGGSSPSVRGGSSRPPVPPPPPSVAMATMHHSQSWSELGLRSQTPETPNTGQQRGDADLEAGSRSDRWTPSSSSSSDAVQSAH